MTPLPPLQCLDYHHLKAYQDAEMIYNINCYFCQTFLQKDDHRASQMMQAALSAKQNIAEGHEIAGTSIERGIKLTNMAKACIRELVDLYEDYLSAHYGLWQGIRFPHRLIVPEPLYRRAERVKRDYLVYIQKLNDEQLINFCTPFFCHALYLLDLFQDLLQKRSNAEVAPKQ